LFSSIPWDYHESYKVIGKTLGHYEILEKIGQGGMGVVYKARDLHLNRFAALKLLPAATAERKARFTQEARAASALNHPNIVTIHDIDSDGGIDYIAMEYIAGRSLESVIGKRACKLADVLHYGIQIADALACAHAAGIAHRDIKPSNLMIGDDGRVKVVDFGLAKLTEPELAEDAATRSMVAQTEPGMVVGTIAYMSPEQAEGAKVDTRTDVFSFGAVLYEMLSGQRAFGGTSNVATLAAILREEPRPLPADAPPELRRMIRRCLRKDLSRRFQSLADLKLELEELRDEPATSAAVEHPAARSWSWRAFAAGAALVAAAGWLWFGLGPSGSPPSHSVLTRLTFDSGLSFQPALSPNGALLVFSSDRAGAGNMDIWLRQIAGGEPARLTKDEADETDPAFSPDGTQIAFRSNRAGGGIYVVSALGGEPRKIADQGRNPRFSPDGTRIAFWTSSGTGDPAAPGQARSFLVAATGGEGRQIAAGFDFAAKPLWSPDGKALLLLGRSEPSDYTGGGLDWWIQPLDGSTATAIGLADLLRARRMGFPTEVAWQGDRLLFSSATGDTTNVWQVALSAGAMRVGGSLSRLTFGTTHEIQPTADAKGRILFTSAIRNPDIWSLPLDGNRGEVKGLLQRETSDAAEDREPSASLDGARLAFISQRGGKLQVWVKESRTGLERAIAPASFFGALSADGERLGFVHLAGNQNNVLIVPVAGGVPVKLCADCGRVWGWSPDGVHLVLGPLVAGRNIIDIANTQTGRITRLLEHPSYRLYQVHFSPDGRWLQLMAALDPSRSRVFVVPYRGQVVPERDWIPVTDGTTWDDFLGWSPDGNLLYFFSDRDGFRCAYAQALAPATRQPVGKLRAVCHLHHSRLLFLGLTQISVTSDRLFLNLAEMTGNIWMLSPAP